MTMALRDYISAHVLALRVLAIFDEHYLTITTITRCVALRIPLGGPCCGLGAGSFGRKKALGKDSHGDTK